MDRRVSDAAVKTVDASDELVLELGKMIMSAVLMLRLGELAIDRWRAMQISMQY